MQEAVDAKPRRPMLLMAALVVLALAVGALAIRNSILNAQREECIGNLWRIQYMKQNWALVEKKGPNAVPTALDLIGAWSFDTTQPYPKNCPSGGTYIIGRVGEPPTCSLGEKLGHVLPPPK